mgnify:CR=1 FL=1
MVSSNVTIVLKVSSWMSYTLSPNEQKVSMILMIVKKIKNGSKLEERSKQKLIKLNTTF